MTLEEKHDVIRLLRCDYCDKESNVMDVKCKLATAINTLNQLPDYNHAIWLCPLCQCWNNDREESPG